MWTDAARRAAAAARAKGVQIAHQNGVQDVGRLHDWGGALLHQAKMFAKNESGEGYPRNFEQDMERDLRKADPDKLAKFVQDQAHNVAGHISRSELVHTGLHLLHFLLFLGGVAVIGVIARAAGLH